MGDQFGQLPLAPHKGGGGRWQVVAGGLAGAANALGQFGRLGCRFDAQLVGQHLLARLVLGESGRQLPIPRQQEHFVAVRHLAQRVNAQQLVGVAQGAACPARAG